MCKCRFDCISGEFKLDAVCCCVAVHAACCIIFAAIRRNIYSNMPHVLMFFHTGSSVTEPFNFIYVYMSAKQCAWAQER